VYIDAGAYSSSLKQKLAQGSPLLMVKHRCCRCPPLACLWPRTCPSFTATVSMQLVVPETKGLGGN
jgi:hypothetical protein